MNKSLKLIILAGIIVLVIGGSYFLLKNNTFSFLQNTKYLSLLWENGQYIEALEMGTGILEENPLHRAALAFSGFSAYMIGRYHPEEEESSQYIVTALSYLRRLQTVDDTVYGPEVQYVLGKAYYALGRLPESLKYLEAAFGRGLRVADIYEHLALLYERFGEYEKAVVMLTDAIEREPADLYYTVLARIQLLRGEYEEAGRLYAFLIENSEDGDMVMEGKLGIARLAHERGDVDVASTLLDRLVTEYPESDKIRTLLGDVLAMLGEEERARYEWREAVRLNPFNAEAIHRLTE